MRNFETHASCLLVIDAQRYCCDATSPQYAVDRPDFDAAYFFHRVETVCRLNWSKLVQQCRDAGVDIVTTVISSLRPDGKDLSRDYKMSGFRVYAESPSDELVDELRPVSANEICLAKTSSSVFQSTHLDYILRNLGTKTLIVAGVLTDQCVDHAVRDAADLGYSVVVIEDACATGTQARHEAALQAFKGYTDSIMSTEAVLKLFEGL